MLTTLKQIINSLRNSWRTNDYEINMVIFQTIIDFCEQHNELGHSNVKIVSQRQLLSGDVKLSGLCTASAYSSEIKIVTDCTEYVEAIDNECSDAKLTELITMLVHEYRHSFQHINKLPMTYVRYTEAGEDVDAYYAHPMEVDAYAYQEKLADETIEYLVANLSKNFKSGHEFYECYRTSFVFDKPESDTVEYEDWEYDMMYDEEEYEF